jgi:hypothetical protein
MLTYLPSKLFDETALFDPLLMPCDKQFREESLWHGTIAQPKGRSPTREGMSFSKEKGVVYGLACLWKATPALAR